MSLFPGVETPVYKAFRQGTHRLIPPEETIVRLNPYLPVMGITRIANVTGLDAIGVPVVMVVRPNARSLSVSQGKGLTLAAAKASGIMESIELYHAEHVFLPLLLGSYEELRHTRRFIEVAQLPQSSDGAFHPNLQALWIEGYDLLQQEPLWLPYALVHCNYTLPLHADSACFPVTSDGLSSGNHLLEAISHGICEVVERDAITLWDVAPSATRAGRRLDLTTVDDPACCSVLEKCARAGVEVAAWDITSNVGLPTFECWIGEQVVDPLRRLYSAGGMGCHPTRQIALLRALTEAIQSRLTLISGARDDLVPSHYEEERNLDLLSSQRAQMAVPVGQLRDFHEVPTFETAETFDDDIEWELDRLRAIGITRVVVVDLTRPEFGIPVVRVVIPGLEGLAADIPNYIFGPRARAAMPEEART